MSETNAKCVGKWLIAESDSPPSDCILASTVRRLAANIHHELRYRIKEFNHLRRWSCKVDPSSHEVALTMWGNDNEAVNLTICLNRIEKEILRAVLTMTGQHNSESEEQAGGEQV